MGGFKTWLQHKALAGGKAIRSSAHKVGSAVKSGVGTVWNNRDVIIEGLLASGTIAGGVASIGTGPLGTIAGIGAVTSGVTAMADLIARVSGGPKDPVYAKGQRAKKRKRAHMESATDTAPTADNNGEKQPKISGDQRSRLANMAAMR